MARDNHDCSSGAGAYVFGVTKKKKGSKEVLQAIHIFKYQAIDFDNNSYVVYMLYICCVYEKIHLHFVFD